MSRDFHVTLPPGFLAEVVAASILGGHLGAHNQGHDLVDSQSQRVEVKSCSLKPAKQPRFLEVATGPQFPREECDSVVFVSTSGAKVQASASVAMSEGHLRMELTAEATRKDDEIRVYRLDRDKFARLLEHGRHMSPDGRERVTWRVAIEDCDVLDLA